SCAAARDAWSTRSSTTTPQTSSGDTVNPTPGRNPQPADLPRPMRRRCATDRRSFNDYPEPRQVSRTEPQKVASDGGRYARVRLWRIRVLAGADTTTSPDRRPTRHTPYCRRRRSVRRQPVYSGAVRSATGRSRLLGRREPLGSDGPLGGGGPAGTGG